jgi:4-hydroxythreonine-4-phosphate dehydrogenase
MNTKKPILIVAGEPFSIFSEILFKSFLKYKVKRPLVVLASIKLFKSQMNYLKYNIPFNKIDKNFDISELKINKINIINVDFIFSKPFKKISKASNLYNKKSFEMALNLLKKKIFLGLINGPISKKHFLKRNFLGITEYLAKKTNTKNFAMLIYNKKLSVSPITTHLPVKNIGKYISQRKIIKHSQLIKKFYKINLNKNPKIAITGLNPHCESIDGKNSEENKIIIPAIKMIKNNISNISGPYPADSLFMRDNIKKFDAVIGMYHDQVLTPIKSIYNFDAINITLGLPFMRISPDHGTNGQMAGKNKSNPQSLISAIKFLDKN